MTEQKRRSRLAQVERRTRLTWHAMDRVHGRLSMSQQAVGDLLDAGKFIVTGYEPRNPDRAHRLFYSEPDCQCFVAVQDERDLFVVTILPLDYTRFPVTIEAQAEARALVLGTAPLELHPERLAALQEEINRVNAPQEAKVYRITGITKHPDGWVSTMNLGSWPIDGRSAEEWGADRDFINAIRGRAQVKLKPGERIVGLNRGLKRTPEREGIPIHAESDSVFN